MSTYPQPRLNPLHNIPWQESDLESLQVAIGCRRLVREATYNTRSHNHVLRSH